MRAIPAAFVLILALSACGGGDGAGEGARLVGYHLEEHWVESKPPTRPGDLKAPPRARVVSCGPPALLCPGVPDIPRRTVYYALTGEPELRTSDFVARSARVEFARASGPVVHVRLTQQGQARFRGLTRHMARVGRRQGRHQQLALIVGDRLVAFPTIDYEQNPDGIDSRVIEITGIGAAKEAEEMAKGLRGD